MKKIPEHLIFIFKALEFEKNEIEEFCKIRGFDFENIEMELRQELQI